MIVDILRNEVTDLTITFKKLEKSQNIMIHIVLPVIQTFIFFICSSILLLFHNLKANDSNFNGGGGEYYFRCSMIIFLLEKRYLK